MHSTGKRSLQGGARKIFRASPYNEETKDPNDSLDLHLIRFRDVQHGIFRTKRLFNRHFIMISFPRNLVILHIVVQCLE